MELSLTLRLRLAKYTGRAFTLTGACLLLFLALHFLFPLRVEVPYSNMVTSSDGRVLSAYLSSDDKWRLYTELEEITPDLKKALLYKEDKYFYYHPGFNPVAATRALVNNILHGKRTSGASTITMQVARLLEPKQRTYGSKLTEIFRAFQLELLYSKEEILQLYLNLVPYGSNIEGVKSASLLFFNKLPNHLSLAEITALAIVPNRPSSLRMGTGNTAIFTERNQWLQRFREARLFAETEIADALEEPLEIRRMPAPHYAPHLSRRLKKDHAHQPVIRSTLDFNKQLQTEALVKNYIGRLRYSKIRNAAVLVVDNRTGQVKAYVGSGDFFTGEDGSQVDGVTAIRSPGSTLKPYLYATAFDLGLITPRTTVTDVPSQFAGYMPENYDMDFNGRVSIEQALARSLNIPAVKVLNDVGVSYFTGKLVQADFKTIRKTEKKLGLSLILGGCGVTLEELSTLYASMANFGKYQRLRYLVADTQQFALRLLTEEAAFMTTNVLTTLTRPDLPDAWQSNPKLPRIAWKTGTSYGRRDAWSIGYNRNYTIGVWVGNFSGEGVPILSGADIATPLLFQLFNSIDYNAPANWYKIPEKVGMRTVCAATGDIAGEFCESKVNDFFIPGISRNVDCECHKYVLVNTAHTLSYCTSCIDYNNLEKVLYPNFPAELVSYYENRKIQYERLPPHNPRCARIFGSHQPIIVSPADGSEYFVDATERQQLALTCQAHNDVETVFWYVNDRLFKKATASSTVFFTPDIGPCRISCTDDKGRTSHIRIVIKKL